MTAVLVVFLILAGNDLFAYSLLLNSLNSIYCNYNTLQFVQVLMKLQNPKTHTTLLCKPQTTKHPSGFGIEPVFKTSHVCFLSHHSLFKVVFIGVVGQNSNLNPDYTEAATISLMFHSYWQSTHSGAVAERPPHADVEMCLSSAHDALGQCDSDGC